MLDHALCKCCDRPKISLQVCPQLLSTPSADVGTKPLAKPEVDKFRKLLHIERTEDKKGAASRVMALGKALSVMLALTNPQQSEAAEQCQEMIVYQEKISNDWMDVGLKYTGCMALILVFCWVIWWLCTWSCRNRVTPMVPVMRIVVTEVSTQTEPFIANHVGAETDNQNVTEAGVHSDFPQSGRLPAQLGLSPAGTKLHTSMQRPSLQHGPRMRWYGLCHYCTAQLR